MRAYAKLFYFSILLVTMFLNLYCGTKSDRAKVIADTPEPVTNKALAHNTLVGTWTGKGYAGDYLLWYKLVVSKDLAANLFLARAVDSGWGYPVPQGLLKIDSAKYINTGARYYYASLDSFLVYDSQISALISVGNYPFHWRGDLILTDSRSANFRVGGVLTSIEPQRVYFVKRDTFPFTP